MPSLSTPDSKNMFKNSYGELQKRFDRMKDRILAKYRGVVDRIDVIYECDFRRQQKDLTTEIGQFFNMQRATCTTPIYTPLLFPSELINTHVPFFAGKSSTPSQKKTFQTLT